VTSSAIVRHISYVTLLRLAGRLSQMVAAGPSVVMTTWASDAGAVGGPATGRGRGYVDDSVEGRTVAATGAPAAIRTTSWPLLSVASTAAP
jgi:hypothetical protein